jgi:hypothetical protein
MDVASLVIGVIALLVGLAAIPTIFQMFFGRPHLTFEADDFTGPEARILVLKIKNEPVKHPVLRLMGVERDAGDLTAFFDVQEQGTGHFLARSMSGLLHGAPHRDEGLLIRILPGFSVGMTIICTRLGTAQIVNGREKENAGPIIPAGHYLAHIAVVRGQRTYKISQEFVVGAEDHKTFWASRTVVTQR